MNATVMNATLSTAEFATKTYDKTIPTPLGRTIVFAVAASDLPKGAKSQIIQAGLDVGYFAPDNEIVLGPGKIVSAKTASGVAYALPPEVNVAELVRLNVSQGPPAAQSEARFRDREMRAEQQKAEAALIKFLNAQVELFAAHSKNPRNASVGWLPVYVNQLRQRLAAIESKSL